MNIGQGRRQARARLLTKARSLPGLRRYPATAVRTAVEARRLRHDLSTVRSFLLFVGHPRSGHSLVGVLLDAHPNVLVAHELDVLRYVEAGFGREQLFVLLRRQQQARAARGGVKSADYAYAVPGQWQGRYRRLEVIGDKKGGKSTLRIGDRPELLDRLASTVAVPLKVIQVVRNPYDNIATMHRRAPRASLADHVDRYFRMAAIADTVRARIPDEDYCEIHLEDLIADPAGTLTGLCSFLDVPAEPDYLEACASIVLPAPRQTRATVAWTPELRATVEARMVDHPALARYLDTADATPATPFSAGGSEPI
ncbi:MAG: sulfotransferase family protein [Jiangellaceae bacterium]